MKFFGSPKRSWRVWTTCGTAAASSFSSVRGVAWACGMFNDCRSAARAQCCVSDGGPHALVPDVFRNRGVNRILGNVGCVIADPFERARNQDEVKISAQLLAILHHPGGQFGVCIAIHIVELL